MSFDSGRCCAATPTVSTTPIPATTSPTPRCHVLMLRLLRAFNRGISPWSQASVCDAPRTQRTANPRTHAPPNHEPPNPRTTEPTNHRTHEPLVIGQQEQSAQRPAAADLRPGAAALLLR